MQGSSNTSMLGTPRLAARAAYESGAQGERTKIQDDVVAAGDNEPPSVRSWISTLVDLEDGLLARSGAQTPVADVVDVPTIWGSPYTTADAWSTSTTLSASLDNDYKNITKRNDSLQPKSAYQPPRADDYVDDEPANVEQTQSLLYHSADYFPPPPTKDYGGDEPANAEQKQSPLYHPSDHFPPPPISDYTGDEPPGAEQTQNAVYHPADYFHYPPPPTGDYVGDEPAGAQQTHIPLYHPADYYNYPPPPTGDYARDEPAHVEQMPYPPYHPGDIQRAHDESQANSGMAPSKVRPWSDTCEDLQSNDCRLRDPYGPGSMPPYRLRDPYRRGYDARSSSYPSTPMPPPEPIRYVPLADGQFRLLRLLTGGGQKTSDELSIITRLWAAGGQFPIAPVPDIRAYLQTFTLGLSPAYRAVSYVWGAPAPEPNLRRSRSSYGKAQPETMTIALSTSESRDAADFKPHLLQSTNLYELLCQLATEKHDCWLWIDNLCINQADDDERSQQIKSMGQIYQSANVVLSWLGREPKPSSLSCWPGQVKKTDYHRRYGGFSSDDVDVGSIQCTIARLNEYDASGMWLTKGDEVIPEIESRLLEVVKDMGGTTAEPRPAETQGPTAKLEEDPAEQRKQLVEFVDLLLNESEVGAQTRHFLGSQVGMAIGCEVYFGKRQSFDLRGLCSLEYWSRRWIVQEVFFARSVKLQYGQNACTLKALQTAIRRLRDSDKTQSSFVEQLAHTPGSKLALHRLDRQTQPVSCTKLKDLLVTYEKSVCQSPYDQVFALYSLIGDHRKHLDIRYSRTAAAHLQAVISFMHEFEGLEVEAIGVTGILLKGLGSRDIVAHDLRVLEAEKVNPIRVPTAAFFLGKPELSEETTLSIKLRDEAQALPPTHARKLYRQDGEPLHLEQLKNLASDSDYSISPQDMLYFRIPETKIHGLAALDTPLLALSDLVVQFPQTDYALIVAREAEDVLVIRGRAHLYRNLETRYRGSELYDVTLPLVADSANPNLTAGMMELSLSDLVDLASLTTIDVTMDHDRASKASDVSSSSGASPTHAPTYREPTFGDVADAFVKAREAASRNA
ncbi:hypothetical protein LTR56_011407 [Elasticomyces elasticus]|nr:hypothetical protein LTR56_011407 [Elasticomyces elasticus]KAK3655999.1 hypothetical protein LTR22_010008 [Elasticomyces elasticus]KAK4921498.1 hypothetical protein LTR49_011152 [Elasticomyces elasticus]KAK5760031.1 hypothetical protein LTS12_009762 [Elasticomyces elasticus]